MSSKIEVISFTCQSVHELFPSKLHYNFLSSRLHFRTANISLSAFLPTAEKECQDLPSSSQLQTLEDKNSPPNFTITGQLLNIPLHTYL